MHSFNNILIIPETKGASFIEIGSIIRVEAVGNYCKMFLLDGRQILVAKVLKIFEEILTSKGFIRIHRSHLINTGCIQTFNSFRRMVVLTNKEEITISRRRSTGFIKSLAEPTAQLPKHKSKGFSDEKISQKAPLAYINGAQREFITAKAI